MADKKMNDFATASDGAYIYAESASGEQIKISKADLASVVAGLLTNLFYTHKIITITDFNLCRDAGAISITDPNLNCLNNPGITYGVLLVFNAEIGYQIQIAVSTTHNTWIRFNNINQNIYGGWTQL